MNDFNWKTLQNGSDIRGVALEGVADEPVNLTPERVTLLGKAFAVWLGQKVEKTLVISPFLWVGIVVYRAKPSVRR